MTQQVRVVRQLVTVCLTGFAAGCLGGFLVAYLPNVLSRAPDFSSETALSSAIAGVSLGAPFGLVAFPACYKFFLSRFPLGLSLAVTFPATVIVAALFEILPVYSPNITYNGWTLGMLIRIYGPALLGLLISSLALNRFAARAIKRG